MKKITLLLTVYFLGLLVAWCIAGPVNNPKNTTQIEAIAEAALPKDGSQDMEGNLGLASNEITEVKSITLSDASVKIIDGKVNGTNYFGMVDSSNNTFRILLVPPTP